MYMYMFVLKVFVVNSWANIYNVREQKPVASERIKFKHVVSEKSERIHYM